MTTHRITTPARMKPIPDKRQAEMWILKGKDAEKRFSDWAQGEDQNAIGALDYAIAEDDKGDPIVVVRAKPGTQRHLEVKIPGAKELAPHSRNLKDLYTPTGHTLPNINSAALRKIFMTNPDHVVWALPNGEKVPPTTGSGVLDSGSPSYDTESIHGDHFKPLSDLVNYEAPAAKKGNAWQGNDSPFDLTPFTSDDMPPRLESSPVRPQSPPVSVKPTRQPKPPAAPKAPKRPSGAGKRPKTGMTPVDLDTSILASTNAEALAKKKEIESKIAAFGNPEAAGQSGLWPQAALANQSALLPDQASLAWQNAIWHDPENPELVKAWAASEQAGSNPIGVIRQIMENERPGMNDANRMAAALTLASKAHDPQLNSILMPAQNWLERHEDLMGSKAHWIMTKALHEHTGDIKGAASRRDRLLSRLKESGLSGQKDVPDFIRQLGGIAQTPSHYLETIHNGVNDWMQRQISHHSGTPAQAIPIKASVPYVNLLGAINMGRASLGARANEIRQMVLNAPRTNTAFGNQEAIGRFDQWLRSALSHRVTQAINGDRTDGPLPPTLNNPAGGTMSEAEFAKRYLKSLVSQSSYNPYLVTAEQLGKEVEKIENLPADKISSAVSRLVDSKTFAEANPSYLSLVTPHLMNFASRIDRETAKHVLEKVGAKIKSIPQGKVSTSGYPTGDQLTGSISSMIPELIHHNMADMAGELLQEMSNHLRSVPDEHIWDGIVNGVPKMAQNMRKIGMTHRVGGILEGLANNLLKGRTLDQIHSSNHGTSNSNDRKVQHARMMAALTRIAGEHLALGNVGHAMPILNATHNWLTHNDQATNAGMQYSGLIHHYFNALGNMEDKGDAAKRIGEVLKKSHPFAAGLGVSAAGFASPFHLKAAEAAYHGIVGEGGHTTELGRRWAGDDEHLVRTRVHADTDKMLKEGGIR